MSQNLTVRVSSKVRDYIRERAAAARISETELTTVFFHFGMQAAKEAAAEELRKMSEAKAVETKEIVNEA